MTKEEPAEQPPHHEEPSLATWWSTRVFHLHKEPKRQLSVRAVGELQRPERLPGFVAAANLGLKELLKQLFELADERTRQGEQLLSLLAVWRPECVRLLELTDPELREARQLLVLTS